MSALKPVKRSKKSKRSKAKELEKALNEEQKKAKELLSRYMYLQADFENYRKRTEKKITETQRFSNEKLIVNLLNILDEMELAIKMGKETENKKALIEGVEMTSKKMYNVLNQEGLTKIEAEGAIFDPNLHEVAEKIPTKDYEENTIIEEIRAGFMYWNKVIRPSMVKIAVRLGDKN